MSILLGKHRGNKNKILRGDIMTLEEKQLIAATARKLINLLDNCDDEKFVNFVVDCVVGNLDYLLEVDKL